MRTPLRVLLVEDSEVDAELILRELQRGGYDPVHLRVTSAATLIEALADRTWDLVLCDYSVPGFRGTEALSLVRSSALDVPFIFVSGTIDEETAVAAMKAGAQDYLIKGKLKRLVPAIERELQEAVVRRERTLAEAALQKLSRAVDHSSSLIVITDATGVIEFANPSMLERMGYTVDEVIGSKPSLWRSGKTSKKEYAKLWETLTAGNDWHGEFENRCKDGSVINVTASISPMMDEHGRISHFISIQEDVTERRALEAQLQQAQKMEAMGQLTGGLAHDLNNLFAVIIGNLDLLQEDLGSDDSAREIAERALKGCLRGSKLTNQLLAFSRRQSLEAEQFDLNQLIAGTTDMLRRTLGTTIEIEVKLAADIPPIFTDPTQLESAFVNLGINARDAMPRGGHLTIETGVVHLDAQDVAATVGVAAGDYVTVSVSDDGTGIPPEVRNKVFEPFFTTKAKGKGTGLGLSMVYGFVKQSGGHIAIDSEVGRGTTVTLYLPQSTGAKKDANETIMIEPDTETGNATILVVEDDDDVRTVVICQLERLGYSIIEARDARTALQLLNEGNAIDLLFTDVVMPGGMSGPELAIEARSLRPNLRVVFTSGYTEAAIENGQIGRLGSLLHKPYRRAELAQKIRDALGRSNPSPK